MKTLCIQYTQAKGSKFDEVMSRIITCIGFTRVYYIRMCLFGVICLFVFFFFSFWPRFPGNLLEASRKYCM